MYYYFETMGGAKAWSQTVPKLGFYPTVASGYTVSEGPTGSKPSFQTVWVSHPTLSERAAGASESCFKIVIPSDYLCNFFRHFTQIFALFPDANLAHCRFGYFLMVLAGL